MRKHQSFQLLLSIRKLQRFFTAGSRQNWGRGLLNKSAGLQTENTQDIGGGLDVGYTSAGQWLEYNVNVEQAGTYQADFRYSVNSGTTGINIKSAEGTKLEH